MASRTRNPRARRRELHGSRRRNPVCSHTAYDSPANQLQAAIHQEFSKTALPASRPVSDPVARLHLHSPSAWGQTADRHPSRVVEDNSPGIGNRIGSGRSSTSAFAFRVGKDGRSPSIESRRRQLSRHREPYRIWSYVYICIRLPRGDGRSIAIHRELSKTTLPASRPVSDSMTKATSQGIGNRIGSGRSSASAFAFRVGTDGRLPSIESCRRQLSRHREPYRTR